MTHIHSSLHLQRIACDVRVGWEARERALPQTLYIDLAIRFHVPPEACTSDKLRDTLCYDQLLQNLQQTLKDREFRLIEHLGYTCYQTIKTLLPSLTEVSVAITKYPEIASLTGGARFFYGDFHVDFGSR